jgi:hypothetical protein
MSRFGAWIAALATTAALVASSPMPALAWSRDFTLYNRTGYTITAVQFSYNGYGYWNTINGNEIGSGQYEGIHFTNNGPCHLQMRLKFADHNPAQWTHTDFNLCADRSLYVYYNSADDSFTVQEREQ